jgi:two-component system sensor histidine kinase KdpD
VRGELRIYLGAAPGVGKTFAMLNEGWRRHQRGTDVVVGYLETHGRERTAEQVRDLEVLPRVTIEYRGGRLEEMDVDAILARRPEVALIDELAHTNVPGSRHEKRWQDVEELLEAGITVISTVNVQHLESLNDVVEQITGVKQRETVPDEVVRAADQVELVDMTPEAIRRRMAHGNIYPSERVDAALSNYFRPGNLAALRELALLWLADKVEAGLQSYMEMHGISAPWETRERVVVALTGAPSGEHLIRRAARMARRSQGDLVGVHIRRDDGLATRDSDYLESQKQLLASLGGSYHEVVGSDVSDALVQFSHAEKATQLVLGASRRSRAAELAHGSIINKTLRSAGEMDVHVISEAADEHPADRRVEAAALASTLVRRRKPMFSRRRRLGGWALCLLGVPALTLVLLLVDTHLNLTSQILLYLALVAASAAVGGRGPGLVTAVVSFLAANWFFTPPVHTLTIGQPENLLALVIFLGLTLLVSVLVSQLSRRQTSAARSRAEAEALARTAGELAGGDPLSGVLAHVRTTFQLSVVAVMARDDDGRWQVAASAGQPVPDSPSGHVRIELQSGATLVLVGAALEADDLQIIRAFANQLDVSLARQRLEEEASRAAALAEADRLRTSILRAVSHDLRTPLASVTASVTSLLDDSVDWSDDDRRILLQTIREETDRLSTLVANLLDMSRIEAGALDVTLRTVGFDEVVPAALSSMTEPLDRVHVEVEDDLPAMRADPALLERVVANLVSNALRYSPPDQPVLVTASTIGDRVELRVIDRGPGIPRAERPQVFEPFQRLGDQRTPASGGATTGVGLGLAVARGFAEAMRGELLLEDTPGGGLTTVLALPAEPVDAAAVAAMADHPASPTSATAVGR